MTKFVMPSLRRHLLKFSANVVLQQNRWILSWNCDKSCRRNNLQIVAIHTSRAD